jgi:hypothetical protein
VLCQNVWRGGTKPELRRGPCVSFTEANIDNHTLMHPRILSYDYYQVILVGLVTAADENSLEEMAGNDRDDVLTDIYKVRSMTRSTWIL